jgi:hypothetical protein
MLPPEIGVMLLNEISPGTASRDSDAKAGTRLKMTAMAHRHRDWE